MEEPLILTDDEVVALAVERETVWRGGLPTVVERDTEALAAAAFRGRRSFTARLLSDQSGKLDDNLLELSSTAAGADNVVLVSLTDAEFTRKSWGLASAHYPCGESWLLELITPLGLHYLSRQPAEDHRTYFQALLSGVAESGPEAPDTDAPTWLSVIAATGGTATLACARRDDVRLATVEIVDGTLDVKGLEPTTVAAATAAVMATYAET